MGSVNLELDEDGEWTAHSIEMPGCMWWAPTKEEALQIALDQNCRFLLVAALSRGGDGPRANYRLPSSPGGLRYMDDRRLLR